MQNFKIILAGVILMHCLSNSMLSFGHLPDSLAPEKTERKKVGLNWNPLPVIAYNSDIGLQYGILLDLYNYGDGTLYPEYKYSIYSEISRTTKGGGINQLFFDSKYLLPYHLRITADISYLTQQALNFYGFNGYEAEYNEAFENDASEQYISRMFYRHQRKLMRVTVDFQGPLYSDKFLWLFGIGYFSAQISTVDIDKLNKGKKEQDKLPDTLLLYDEYVAAKIIKVDEKNGGNIPCIKTGFIYDSRDNDANPMKGIWSEALLFIAPEILGNKDFFYLKLALTHRQYFTIIKKKLSFVYRLGYQGKIAGRIPFYMKPYMLNSYAKTTTTDGLGGEKTIRGVLLNRVVGDGIAFGNFELRWRFLQTVIWNQNIYLGLNLFFDAGTVVQKTEINFEEINAESENLNIDSRSESLHCSMGGGLRIAINTNFVIAADYGIALDDQDGSNGLYIGLGYLF